MTTQPYSPAGVIMKLRAIRLNRAIAVTSLVVLSCAPQARWQTSRTLPRDRPDLKVRMNRCPECYAPGGALVHQKMWPSTDFPPIGDQCDTNSCVGWAVGYALRSFIARSIQEDGRTWSPATQVSDCFSPSWVWNGINGGGNNVANVEAAFCWLNTCGGARWPYMPFTCDVDE